MVSREAFPLEEFSAPFGVKIRPTQFSICSSVYLASFWLSFSDQVFFCAYIISAMNPSTSRFLKTSWRKDKQLRPRKGRVWLLRWFPRGLSLSSPSFLHLYDCLLLLSNTLHLALSRARRKRKKSIENINLLSRPLTNRHPIGHPSV